jgi:hypothetical protein
MKHWFKAKRYGWGWYPATWQGWALTLLFCVLFATSTLLYTYALGIRPDHVFALASTFICFITICTGFLLWICYTHGEKPRWRWG